MWSYAWNADVYEKGLARSDWPMKTQHFRLLLYQGRPWEEKRKKIVSLARGISLSSCSEVWAGFRARIEHNWNHTFDSPVHFAIFTRFTVGGMWIVQRSSLLLQLWNSQGSNRLINSGLILSLPSSKSAFSQPFKDKCISEVVRIW